MNKYGEETTDDTHGKTAAPRTCPTCQVSLEELEGTGIFVCPNCGKRPLEKGTK